MCKSAMLEQRSTSAASVADVCVCVCVCVRVRTCVCVCVFLCNNLMKTRLINWSRHFNVPQEREVWSSLLELLLSSGRSDGGSAKRSWEGTCFGGTFAPHKRKTIHTILN